MTSEDARFMEMIRELDGMEIAPYPEVAKSLERAHMESMKRIEALLGKERFSEILRKSIESSRKE